MPQIDFKEIPSGEGFEQFAREFFSARGCRVLEGPSRGADAGRDLVIEEVFHSPIADTSVRWMVSCKHYAHSRKPQRAVGVYDEPSIDDRVLEAKVAGFIGFYSTIASAALEARLQSFAPRFRYKLYAGTEIESLLLSDSRLEKVLRQFFPRVHEARQKSLQPIRFIVETQTGEYYGRDSTLSLDVSSLFQRVDPGVFSVADEQLQDVLSACVIVGSLRRSNFQVLRGFKGLRPRVAEFVSQLLADTSLKRPALDESALAKEIRSATDPAYIRLLVRIAGVIGAVACVEPICRVLLTDGRRLIRQFASSHSQRHRFSRWRDSASPPCPKRRRRSLRITLSKRAKLDGGLRSMCFRPRSQHYKGPGARNCATNRQSLGRANGITRKAMDCPGPRGSCPSAWHSPH